MTPERWQQVKDIFDRAVECAPASRMAYIRERCGDDEELRREVESLLASDTATGSLLANPLIETAIGRADTRRPQGNLEGRLIGPYQVLREIGRGGMGVVYLASRADHAFHRFVAIKIVHAGSGSGEMIARFEQEREILASLDHPNIARLLDGGTTSDGLQYLVMEYVEGHAIDVYCDERKLDIVARLRLFRTVCAAVEYAHHEHIIHRDLKPANILVTTEGTVKLLDFGIAKLVPGRDVETTGLITRTGMRLMTPEYASPEQIKCEAVSAATDIYALGVVLYELLTGHLPYRLRSRIFHEIVRVICDEPPTRPRTAVSEVGDTDTPGSAEHVSRVRRTSPTELRRRLSGDLDGIVLKALEKHPRDRYRSASGFSSDIEKHLEGRPVAARQARVVYRAGKLMQRNLPWVILIAALASAFATGGITINLMGAVVIGGCLLAVGVWYAATNEEVGRRVAESEFLFARVPFRNTVAAWLTSSFSLINLATRFWKPSGVVSLVLFLVAILLSAVAMRQTAGWLGRRRSAGGLLLDLSTARYARVGAVLFLFGLGFVALCAWLKAMLDLYYGVYVMWMGLFLFLNGRLEIRARGIVFLGTLYSWERIESHDWSVDPNEVRLARARLWGQNPAYIDEIISKTFPGTKSLLRLRLRGGIQFLPPVRIPVPLGRHSEVEAIMSRYLSEWPAPDPQHKANDSAVLS